MDIKALAQQAESYIIERRRCYHAHPELTGEEKETQARIYQDLVDLGITDLRNANNCYGVIATIHGGKPGKTVALRADIDALPVPEGTGLPFASEVEGKMHACGHDTHVAMLLGAAKILQENREELCGNVRLIFQPAEENVTGATLMIEDGALEGVDAIYGAHIWGNYDAPYFNVEMGPRMAYAGIFNINVKGTAAHGSAPHLGADAIAAAAAIINNVQQYVSRMNDPMNPLVVTIGTIQGGMRFNVIPNFVTMEGTLRAYTDERHVEVLTKIVENTASALGCEGELVYNHVVGAVYNREQELVDIAKNAATKLYGAQMLTPLEKMLGSEDFGNYAAVVPGVYAFLGSRNVEKGITFTNHHEKFDVDESVMQRGTAVMAQFAVDYLEKHAE